MITACGSDRPARVRREYAVDPRMGQGRQLGAKRRWRSGSAERAICKCTAGRERCPSHEAATRVRTAPAAVASLSRVPQCATTLRVWHDVCFPVAIG